MKTLLVFSLTFLCSSPLTGAVYKWQGVPTRFVTFVKNVNPKISYKDSVDIVYSVLKYSNRFKLNPEKMLGIIATESGFNRKVGVSKTRDFGLTQIHHKTAKMLGLSKEKLVSGQIDYSVYAMSLVLSRFKVMYFKKEGEYYYTRYNSPTPKFRRLYHSKVSGFINKLKEVR